MPLGALQTAGALDAAEAPAQLRDTLAHPPPVHLELRLAGSARAHPAAALARQVGPLPGEPRQEILELRQLDLQLALEAPGTLREDVEDERAAIDDLAAERLLEVALLRRGERIVEDHDVGVLGLRPGR